MRQFLYCDSKNHPPLKTLFLAVSFFCASTLPAQAVWLNNNLRDGLSLNIYGNVSPSATLSKSHFTYLYDDPSISNITHFQDTDERPRLDDINSGHIGFSANKRLNRDWTISGVSVIYATIRDDNNPNPPIVYNYGLTLNHDHMGRIGINSGYSFAANDKVHASGTYHLLNQPEAPMISGNYTGIPNLELSAYYAFPNSRNVNNVNKYVIGGHGIGASHTWSFAPRNELTTSVAYLSQKSHQNLQGIDNSKSKTAHGIGATYTYNDWKINADFQEANAAYNHETIDTRKQRAYGIGVDYEINPRLSAYAKYGVSDNQAKTHAGKAIDIDYFKANSQDTLRESILFDNIKKQKMEIGAEYLLWNNISITSSIEKSNITNYLAGDAAFSKTEDTTFNIGTSLSF